MESKALRDTAGENNPGVIQKVAGAKAADSAISASDQQFRMIRRSTRERRIGLSVREMLARLRAQLLVEGLVGKRDLAIARSFLYAGAHSVLNTLQFLQRRGHTTELHDTIERYGGQLAQLKSARGGA